MSYKINKQNPKRKELMAWRRKEQLARQGSTDLYAKFLASKYIPGNGPNHKLGDK